MYRVINFFSLRLLRRKILSEVLELRRILRDLALVLARHIRVSKVGCVLAHIEEFLEILLAKVRHVWWLD